MASKRLNYEDYLGQKFGRLTVVGPAEPKKLKNGRKITQFSCNCDCGTTNVIVPGIFLKRKIKQSCGCIRREGAEKQRLKKEKIKQNKQLREQKKINKIKEKEARAEARRKQKELKELEKIRKREAAHGNKYEFHEDYVVGYTHNNNTPFYVDIEDYDKIKPYTWYDRITNKTTKTIATMMKTDGRSKSVTMHVFLGYKGYDHINKNELDNRKENLRECTHAENMRNKKTRINSKSGFAGVIFNPITQKWIAQIGYNYKNIRLGTYSDKEEAIKARLKAEKEYFGDFAPQKDFFEQYGI